MRSLGWVVLMFAAGFGIYALSMDTSVDAGGMFGRVNNIGLMNDKQNYLMIAGASFIGGLMMVLFENDGEDPVSKSFPAPQTIDPFDEIEAAAENDRKRYAISLGVQRENGKYWFGGGAHTNIETAIEAAEAAKADDDPAKHFLG